MLSPSLSRITKRMRSSITELSFHGIPIVGLTREHYVSRHPDRFRAFATVALQSPRAAADELQSAVTGLGSKGALINGYIGNADTARYLDESAVWEFWDRVAQPYVPVYLHPREPLPRPRRIMVMKSTYSASLLSIPAGLTARSAILARDV